MRKQLLRVLILASLICLALTVTAFADDATVTGNEVNMRSGPGTNYEVIDCLEKGATVTVNDCSNYYWYNVTYNGKTGFMASGYLKINPAPIVEQVTESATQNGHINAMYVRFRSGPGTDYSVLGEYNTGTKLTITGSSGGWTQVNINGKDGYVYASYVSVDESPATADPVQQQPEPAQQPVQEQPAPVQEPSYQVAAQAERTGTISGNYVRFRTGPGTNYTIITDYNSGTPLTLKGSSGSWYQVVINGTEGFVFSQYVKLDAVQQAPAVTEQPAQQTDTDAAATVSTAPEITGYIRGNSVRFRAGASTNTQIIAEYNSGTALKVTGHSGAWTKCVINGKEGFVYSDYVTENKPAVSGEGSDTGKKIAAFALQYLGYPYVWAGSSPETGFDCSGFVYYVYKQFGYTIQRVACNQANEGVHVDHANIQPGDILCFYSGDNYIGHSGIYIGNGQFIHSSTETTGVIISDLNTDAYEARRVA